jgi:hypothetical protein
VYAARLFEELLWLVARTNVCMAVAATDCIRHACRVKGGQELVAAIQAAKQARLKVRPRWSTAQTTCGDLGVPKPKAGSMAVFRGGRSGVRCSGSCKGLDTVSPRMRPFGPRQHQAARAAH